MSVQFGRWSFAGEPPSPQYIEKVSACIAPYGPDSSESYSADGIRILYRGFHTTKESRREKRPHICPSGAVITWDGRLDTREDLIPELQPWISHEDSDVAIAAAAFEKWGTDCLARLIGDWALSIWDSRHRSLILAKDPIGPRHLYYALEDGRITWCTILDPLVLFADKTFKVCEEYIAGWLSFYPATHITPYLGISSVPPASCVFLGPRKHIVANYWDFDPEKKVRYRTDAEYEEHFRAVFFKAVERRLRSDAPVLAELSGGRDSSSIVCVADELMTRGEAETPRLDTISWYSDSEAAWDDRPYFAIVEGKRGCIGYHIDVDVQDEAVEQTLDSGQCVLAPAPTYDARTSTEIKMCLASRGNRVVLSGIGGDEVMGGVPVPMPELQDLLIEARLRLMVHQIKAWTLQKRVPWLHLLLETVGGFFPVRLVGVSKYLQPGPWLSRNFVKRHWSALTGYPARVKLFGPSPTFQDNVKTLNGLRRQVACKLPPAGLNIEKRYPYLDRNLLEFMFAIPRSQSVRPNQRRSLMRRALVGIVPAEILNRKKKAIVCRAPLVAVGRKWNRLVNENEKIVTSLWEIVDAERISAAVDRVRHGEQRFSRSLLRTLYIEEWLRNLLRLEILTPNVDRAFERFGTRSAASLPVNAPK